MSEHQGQNAEVVGVAPAHPRADTNLNPARWVLQHDGRYRWWGGGQWFDEYTADPHGPVAVAAVARIQEIDSGPTNGAAGANDHVVRLRQLAELRDAGVVTEEEFAAKKAEILDRM